MSELFPCLGCRRHFRTAETACPFCGQDRRPASRSRAMGALTRAAVFAGAAMLLPACGSPQPQRVNNDTDATDGSGGAVKQRDENSYAKEPPEKVETPEERKEREEREAREREALERQHEDQLRRRNNSKRCVNGVCPPYGAPPSLEDRIV